MINHSNIVCRIDETTTSSRMKYSLSSFLRNTIMPIFQEEQHNNAKKASKNEDVSRRTKWKKKKLRDGRIGRQDSSDKKVAAQGLYRGWWPRRSTGPLLRPCLRLSTVERILYRVFLVGNQSLAIDFFASRANVCLLHPHRRRRLRSAKHSSVRSRERNDLPAGAPMELGEGGG